jgi:hypothetical protein
LGQYICKKACKTKEQAEQYRLELCKKLGTNNITFHEIKGTEQAKYGRKLFSYLNKDVVNRQGVQNIKPQSRLALLFPDKDVKLLGKNRKLDSLERFICAKYNYSILPVGTRLASNIETQRS